MNKNAFKGIEIRFQDTFRKSPFRNFRIAQKRRMNLDFKVIFIVNQRAIAIQNEK